jgi:hypothetical protein
MVWWLPSAAWQEGGYTPSPAAARGWVALCRHFGRHPHTLAGVWVPVQVCGTRACCTRHTHCPLWVLVVSAGCLATTFGPPGVSLSCELAWSCVSCCRVSCELLLRASTTCMRWRCVAAAAEETGGCGRCVVHRLQVELLQEQRQQQAVSQWGRWPCLDSAGEDRHLCPCKRG